jgi:hypothetical protein
MIFLLALFFSLTSAGEVGLRLEGPEATGSLWISEAWEILFFQFTGRAELSLFPLGFRMASLKLGASSGPFLSSVELNASGTGRIDLFLSGTAKGSTRVGDFTVLGQIGTKSGWAGVNLAPSAIFLAWGMLGIEKGDFSGEVFLSGPSPWEPSLKLRYGPLSFALSRSTSLEISAERVPWALSSSFQIWPKFRKHRRSHTPKKEKLRAWLGSAGNFGIRSAFPKGIGLPPHPFFSFGGG